MTSQESIKKGIVYLVGAGPGDPGLITVRGLELLGRAEVVIYDYLANRKLLAHVPKEAKFIYVGKKGGVKHTHTQDEINQLLVEHGLAGYRVVRLKGGDPFIFGRGGEEIEELVKAGIPFEVVPGVTSATAAATYAGIPITHRGYTSSVAFITGHEDPTKDTTNIAWDKLATAIGTLVFYMGIKNLPTITEKLMANGRSPQTPVAVVRWASTPEQQSVVGTLETIAEKVRLAGLKPPAIVIVGEVVQLRDTINWYEKRPLFGKRIMVTRTREQASELVHLLTEQGAECLERSTISIAPPDSWDEFDQALSGIESHQWLLFTSINAVTCFFKRLFDKGCDVRILKGIKIGVVGTASAEALRQYGLTADLLPEKFTGEGLAEALVKTGVSGQNILVPRAQKAGEKLVDILSKARANVRLAPVYQNVRPKGEEDQLRRELSGKKVDVVTFTSSSTVTNFLEMLNPKDQNELAGLLDGVLLAAIGPVTAKTIEEAGLTVHIQPETYTIPALVASIIGYFSACKSS